MIPNGEATSSQPEGEDSVLKQREPPDGSEGAGDPPAAGDPGLEEERPQRRGIMCDSRNRIFFRRLIGSLLSKPCISDLLLRVRLKCTM